VSAAKTVRFDELDPETQDDVIHSIARITKEDQDDVRTGLENGPASLPLVTVDPSWAWGSLPPKDRAVSPVVVKKYKEAWLRGDEFPPIVIASDDRIPLHEGLHRAASAIRAGIRKIPAIDLAGVEVAETPEGLETYRFRPTSKRRRRRGAGRST
jgi:hypothetical protein